MLEVVGKVLASEFFWGIIVGLVLTAIGSYLLVHFQAKAQAKDRRRIVASFCADTMNNVAKIIEDMNQLYTKTQLIHQDYLTLLDVETNVFGRNREHLIVLPRELRDKVRAFITDCAIRRAEIGTHLGVFGSKWTLADDLFAQGSGPQSTRVRQEAADAIARAKAALDQLVVRSKDAPGIINELK